MNIPISDFKEIEASLGQENINKLLNKTVLITGGSGFLGSLFTRFLLYLNNKYYFQNNEADSISIISVDNFIGRDKEGPILNPAIKYVDFDLTKPLNRELIGNNIDLIISCVGNASPNAYNRFPKQTIDISVAGTVHLLELAKEYKAKILCFSSSEVLSWPQNIPTPETDLPCASTTSRRSCYDISKQMLETLCYIYKNEDNVDVKVVRLFNAIGYITRNDYRVIPNFMTKVIHGQPIEFFAPGTQTRTFSFWTDVIAGCFLVLLNGENFLYHIGMDKEEISVKDLAYKIARLVNREDLVKMVATPELYKTEPQRRCPNIDKARNELGYNPKVSLDEALRRIYAFYCQHHGIKT